MNKIIITIAGLLLLGTLTAAIINRAPRLDSEQPTQNTQVATTTENAPLVGTTWVWDMTVDHKGDIVQPEDGFDFQLTFGPNGTLTSTTDCNSIGGEYTVHDEVLSIGSLVATEMFCSEESLEQAYAGRLGMVSSHIIEGDALTLILVKDAGMMSFSAKR